MEQADSEVRRLNRRLNDTQQEYHGPYQAGIKPENLAERYDDMPNSIRSGDGGPGIDPPDPLWQRFDPTGMNNTIIETALGQYPERLSQIPERLRQAKLIEYLKKNNMGLHISASYQYGDGFIPSYWRR